MRDLRGLATTTGRTIDSELAAILSSAMTFTSVQTYLAAPKRERPRLRERLIAGMLPLSVGGFLDVAGLKEPKI